jgi:hypothetical protein
MIRWLAFKVQHPDIKINHALVMGGPQGIGKDTLLEPVKHGVGHWNFKEISPADLKEQFNPYIRSVILRISEARDLGEVDLYALYEATKTLIASPPDVLKCNEKHIRHHTIVNVTGVVYTRNYRTTGLYLPADDRRHYVAWSEKVKEDFGKEYWGKLWDWYENGGLSNVVAYLRSFDLSSFNPKAPPPLTNAWHAIVDANCAPEEAELVDALEVMGDPDALIFSHSPSMSRTSSCANGSWSEKIVGSFHIGLKRPVMFASETMPTLVTVCGRFLIAAARWSVAQGWALPSTTMERRG